MWKHWDSSPPGKDRETFSNSKLIECSARSNPSPEPPRSEEHTSELQSHVNLVCRLLLEKKKKKKKKKKIQKTKKKKNHQTKKKKKITTEQVIKIYTYTVESVSDTNDNN